MSKKKSIWYIISIIIIIVLFIVLLFSHCGNKQQNDDKIQDDTGAVEWNGKQSLPTGNNGIVNAIEIPGFNELIFQSDTLSQKVNFYNPENNNCYFQMNLVVANETVWQSGMVQPGHGYYDIKLTRKLKSGEYPAYLNIKCYSQDGEQLNSANVRFGLIVTDIKQGN